MDILDPNVDSRCVPAIIVEMAYDAVANFTRCGGTSNIFIMDTTPQKNYAIIDVESLFRRRFTSLYGTLFSYSVLQGTNWR